MRRLVSAIAILGLMACNIESQAQSLEEFYGPLQGWADVQKRFGAKGDGITDDTKAIQHAIDSFSQSFIPFNTGKQGYFVLYLPAGVYSVSSTLTLTGKVGVSIMGASPNAVTIKWNGGDNDTMFTANGSAYFKIGRIRWDGNGHKNLEALGIHWKNETNNAIAKSTAPTNIEVSDNIFSGGLQSGISGGTIPGEGTGAMDAEITIRRCTFNKCATAIKITGYNALDYWIWDCRFNQCDFGVKCNSGNYHVYRSYFNNCYSDVENTNSYYISLRGCFSENDTHFCYDQGASSNPFKRLFQGNTVIAPKEIPVISYHLGKIMMLDNSFDSASGKTVKSFVETGVWPGGKYQVLSINNRFRNAQSVQFNQPNNRLFSYSDKSRMTITPDKAGFLAAMDNTPELVKRPVYSVAAGATAADIQATINTAVSHGDQKSIVYFPRGKYLLDRPLVIPAHANIELLGEGFLNATVIVPAPSFPKGKALINITGPTKVAIREMQLGEFYNTGTGVRAIQCTNVDQAGSQAFIDQLYSNSKHSVSADGLDYLYVQQTNSFFSDGKSITGGPLVQQGKGTAVMYCFGGQSAGLRVDNNATAVAKDCWWEGAAAIPYQFSGSGNITVDGAMIAPQKADSNTTVSIGKFNGKIALMNMYLSGGISVEPNNPKLNLLLWNINFYFALRPMKFVTAASNYQVAGIGLTAQCFTAGQPQCADVNILPDVVKPEKILDSFFPAMLADDRAAMPRRWTVLDKSKSSIFISRVAAGDCEVAIGLSK